MAVRFWSENMLLTTQIIAMLTKDPHGLSLGFDGKISDGCMSMLKVVVHQKMPLTQNILKITR